MTASNKQNNKLGLAQTSLQALTAAALALPGLLAAPPTMAEDDEVDFSYSHYQEGQRSGNSLLLYNAVSGVYKNYALPKPAAPIEADTIRGSARVSLTDRIKFGFNYIEDIWSGATPYGSAPENSHAYGTKHITDFVNADGDYVLTTASPLASGGESLTDGKGHFFTPSGFDPNTGNATSYVQDRMAHVMGYASPEIRKQGDFKLSYDWDNAQVGLGGGVSTENDFDSRFVNLSGRLDLNHKRTILDFSQSYTSSDVKATNLGGRGFVVLHPKATDKGLFGNRQDWTSHLGLTQVISQDAVVNLGIAYGRNTGLLENPYKATWIGGIDPSEALIDGFYQTHGQAFFERRPDARNQWSGNLGWTQYVQPLEAALHFNYQFSHDDWDVNAHTFDVDWVQPLGDGWSLTPRVRYYSQSAANFYQPYFVVGYDNATLHYDLPNNFSSDQRLSSFGALSGGVVLAKQFAKGVSFETGFEYYSHRGNLKLGGGGEQAFADFDYWVANAALKVKLSAIGRAFDGGGAGDEHGRHAEHANVPAGLMFAHTLNKAGDVMVGYRYQHSRQAGGFLHGGREVSQDEAAIGGCPGALRVDADGLNHYDGLCPMLPTEMTQSMHMLELMYAPTDWLTLMLMPQFMDMQMPMSMPALAMKNLSHGDEMDDSTHQSGGLGDTGFYALVTLFDTPNHHLHAGVGGSAPTGDVAQIRKDGLRRDATFMDYSMQLGSGTWDLKPSLTYTGKAEAWHWGGQLGGTWRAASRNASAYKLGDIFETSVWGGYDWTDWLSSSVRLAYTWQGPIKGRFPRSTRFDSQLGSCNQVDFTYSDLDPDTGEPIGDPYFHPDEYTACQANIEDQKRANDATDHMSSQDYPRNYGGHYLDLGLGVAVTIPNGAFAGHRLAFEWQQPLYTNVNGYQLDRDHALTFTWSYGF